MHPTPDSIPEVSVRPDDTLGRSGEDELDIVWRALASPLRRAILDLLRQGPRPTSDIVLAFPHLSRFGVMQHLGVLEEAGLVVAQKLGRVRLNFLNVVPIRMIHDRWISAYEAQWADELLGIKSRLEGAKSQLERDHAPSAHGRKEISRLNPISRDTVPRRKR